MGHAIQNSRALLNALHEQERTLEMVHCCVGPFNTTKDKDGNNCAILIGKLENHNNSLNKHRLLVQILKVLSSKNVQIFSL